MRIIGEEVAGRYGQRAAAERHLLLDMPDPCIVCGAPGNTCTHDRPRSENNSDG